MAGRRIKGDATSKSGEITFAGLAEELGGERAGRKEDFSVLGLCTLEEGKPGHVSFVADSKFLAQADQSQASGFLTTRETVVPNRPCIVLDNVWKGMLFLLEHFHGTPPPEPSVHSTAVVGSDVSLGENVWIGPYVVIEDGAIVGDGVRIGAHGYVGRDARIGRDTLLHPRVTILHGCEVGCRVILHPGAVIGADGFKYEMIDEKLAKIPQVGRVVLEDDVEIGANTCIDRASLAETRVGRGVKIDNLCQLGHNVTVGPETLMAAQVGIAGSTRVGAGCLMGGQVGIRDNVTIGDRVTLLAKSGVNADLPSNEQYFGTPALRAREYMRMFADMKRLSDMRKRLREIERKLEKSGGS